MTRPPVPAGPSASVVIVSYNSKGLLDRCLDSIGANTSVAYEVIVVDNDSPDGSGDWIAENRPEVVLVRAGGNLGFGRANNLGAERATGTYLFFLNPDTELRGPAVDILVAYLETHPGAGACCGSLVDEAGRPAHSHLSYELGLTSTVVTILPLFDRLVYGPSCKCNHTGAPMRVASASGADLLVRADLFRKLGGFDPGFFMYYEDMDLCRRIRGAGWDIVSVPEAVVMHLEARSFGENAGNARLVRLAESRYLYYSRILHRPWQRIALRAAILCSLRMRIAATVFSRETVRDAWRRTYGIERAARFPETVISCNGRTGCEAGDPGNRRGKEQVR